MGEVLAVAAPPRSGGRNVRPDPVEELQLIFGGRRHYSGVIYSKIDGHPRTERDVIEKGDRALIGGRFLLLQRAVPVIRQKSTQMICDITVNNGRTYDTITVNNGGHRSDVMHELSLRIGRAVQTHFQNFLREERCDSFADSRSYCRWRSALIVKVMQLN